MKFLPRSLLWRTVLLIALLMVCSHLAWMQVFRLTEREPMARRFAGEISSIINLSRSALIAAAPSRRLDLLRSLSQEESIQIYPADDEEVTTPLPEGPPGTEHLGEELRSRLGANTQLAGTVDGVTGLWVSFELEDQKYWLRMPRERLPHSQELRWISWGALVLVLSVLGAVLMVARINRPLRQLARAAALIGRGQTPPPIAESGPTEIETLAHAFNQMNSDLQRTDADRALLLAGVSHDLRTPLARIRLGMEMLGNDDALKAGMAQDIEDIDAVIGQFLDFARVGQETAHAEPADLDALVSASAERYVQHGQAVTARTGGVPALPMNTAAMQRLINNLVDNALRHGSPGVEIETAREGAWMRLSVLDRGPGIPAADAERMLQPFTRLNAARSTSGSGLGLAIVDRIAKMHGGRVRLLARAGGGLEVRVDLPLSRPRTARAPAADGVAETPPGSGLQAGVPPDGQLPSAR